MKNSFRMIGAVCMATAMGICFTACSDDDETEMIEKQGRLVEHSIIIKGDNDYNYKTTFTYNDDGRLAMATHSHPINDPDAPNIDCYTDIFYYNWGNNDLTIINDGGSNYTYTLNDNLITSFDRGHNDISYFKYNLSKQLMERDGYLYIWQDGKLLKETSPESRSITYKYSGKTCKGWFPNYTWAYSRHIHEDLFMAHPELFGMRINQLPDQEYDIYTDDRIYHYDSQIGETQTIDNKSETTTEYDYEFYPDGYLKSYTETTTRVYTKTYSFKDKNKDGVISPDERNVTETEEYTDTPTLYTFKWE